MFRQLKQPVPYRPRRGFCWAIGHRGHPETEPENTLASFEAAIHAGADMVEFDVSFTRDRRPVVLHDRTVDRTTNGHGAIARMTFAEVRKLNAGHGQRIPLLDEVLELVSGRVAANIEIKREAVRKGRAEGIESEVVKAVQRFKANDRVVISSFAPMAIARSKELDSEIPTALLFPSALSQRFAVRAKGVGADAVHVPLRGIKKEQLEYFQDEEIPVRVYTVNEEADMIRLMKLGVDGIFTDRIRTLVELASARG